MVYLVSGGLTIITLVAAYLIAVVFYDLSAKDQRRLQETIDTLQKNNDKLTIEIRVALEALVTSEDKPITQIRDSNDELTAVASASIEIDLTRHRDMLANDIVERIEQSDTLSYWEKSCLVQAIGALHSGFYRLCQVALEQADIPEDQYNDEYVPKDSNIEKLTATELTKLARAITGTLNATLESDTLRAVGNAGED